MNSIQFIHAARAAVVIVGLDLYVNRGKVIGGLAVGILGYLGITLYKSMRDEWSQWRFRVCAPYDFDPDHREAGLKKAIQKIAEQYPAGSKSYNECYELSTVEQVFAYFRGKMKDGVCYGTLAARFKVRREVSPEEVYYYQILQLLRFHLESLPFEMGFNNAVVRIKQEDPLCRFHSSRGFSVESSAEVYLSIFEEVSRGKDILGVVHIPGHVIGIQTGPEGYFLYDSLDSTKGLFNYPNNKIFFEELRSHAIFDVERIKKFLGGKGNQVFYQLLAAPIKPMLT